MRIDAYGQIAQLYGVQTTYNAQSNNNGKKAMGSDQLSISQTGYNHQVAKSAVSEASDIREEKVARLKAQIQAGTYSVNPEDLANKLFEPVGSYRTKIMFEGTFDGQGHTISGLSQNTWDLDITPG